MRDFFRAFALSFALGVLFFAGISAFGVTAASFEDSGFSSGALFMADFVGKSLFGEILGKPFALNLAALSPPPWFSSLAVLLPPPVKLLVKWFVGRV